MKEYFIHGKGRSGKDLYFSGYLSSWNLPMWSPDPNNEHVIKYTSRKVAEETLKHIEEKYGGMCLKIVYWIKRKDKNDKRRIQTMDS